jgi:hypothetical protein
VHLYILYGTKLSALGKEAGAASGGAAWIPGKVASEPKLQKVYGD